MKLPEGLVRLEGKLGVAYFSEDRRYRYLLTRRIADGFRKILWIMLNPSTANHEKNDMTITKCIGFARAMQASEILVVNLFGLITTDPKVLVRTADAVGALNEQVVRAAGQDCDKVIVAWGGLPSTLNAPSHWMRSVIRELYAPKLQCLGRTKEGFPHHPSRIAYATVLENW